MIEYLGYQLLAFSFVNYFGAAFLVIKGARSIDPATIIMWLMKQDMRMIHFLQIATFNGISFFFMGVGMSILF